jgi:hypothetical protein
MAPSFFWEISQRELETFPPTVKLLLQVYEEDDCNDHRIARDLFINISIPNSEKDFMLIMSDSSTSYPYKLHADHALPFNSNDPEGEIDGLDYYGIFRYLDALAEYTFTQNFMAKELLWETEIKCRDIWVYGRITLQLSYVMFQIIL